MKRRSAQTIDFTGGRPSFASHWLLGFVLILWTVSSDAFAALGDSVRVPFKQIRGSYQPSPAPVDFFEVIGDRFKGIDDPAQKAVERGRAYHQLAVDAQKKELAAWARAKAAEATLKVDLAEFDRRFKGQASTDPQYFAMVASLQGLDNERRNAMREAQDQQKAAVQNAKAEADEFLTVRRLTQDQGGSGMSPPPQQRAAVPFLPLAAGFAQQSGDNGKKPEVVAAVNKPTKIPEAPSLDKELTKLTELSDDKLILAALNNYDAPETPSGRNPDANVHKVLEILNGSSQQVAEISSQAGSTGGNAGASIRTQDSGASLVVRSVLSPRNGSVPLMDRNPVSMGFRRPDSTSGRLLNTLSRSQGVAKPIDTRGVYISLGKDWMLVRAVGAPDLNLPANAYSVSPARAVTGIRIPKLLGQTLARNNDRVLGSRAASRRRAVVNTRVVSEQRREVIQGSYVEGRWHEGTVVLSEGDDRKGHRGKGKDPFSTEIDEPVAAPTAQPAANPALNPLLEGEMGGFYKRAIESVTPLLEQHGMSVK